MTSDDSYMEPMDTTPQQGASMGQTEGSKLPPVLANLMGNLGNSGRSPQTTGPPGNTAAPAVNVQELLNSIMVRVVLVLSLVELQTQFI